MTTHSPWNPPPWVTASSTSAAASAIPRSNLRGSSDRKGSVTGLDAAERFIDQADEEAEEAGVENVEFRVADVQAEVPGGPYDYAFARMGTMFFANPVAAMRNVSEALSPGGKLCMIVWRQKLDNPFMFRTEEIVDRYVTPPDPDESDALTCGPGPFSMANADTTSAVLGAAGFEQIALRRVDVEIEYGASPDEAVEAAFALGPAAETMRLAGDSADELRPQIAVETSELWPKSSSGPTAWSLRPVRRGWSPHACP